MSRDNLNFLFLNVAHFLDHLFMLIFATVAALRLVHEWDLSYGALIPYATPGFVAFGVCAIPAGWIGDKWSRTGMIVIFFIGTGAGSILVALADSPMAMALALLVMGVFAAIYHPVGIAMVIQGRRKTGIPIAINGVFGNLGVATAALLTGYLIDTGGWRHAFVVPGLASIGLGIVYAGFVWTGRGSETFSVGATAGRQAADVASIARPTFVRVLSIIVFTTAIGGLIFQSTTFALPKIFDERLHGLAGSATAVGGYAFMVFAIAAMAQLVVGYLVDRYSVRTVFAFVGGLQAVLFAIMYQLTGSRRPGGRGRLHAGRVRTDPHQRRAHRPDHQERVAQPGLLPPLHRDLLGHGHHAAVRRRHSRELGLRRAVRGDGGGGRRGLRRGVAAAADRRAVIGQPASA